MMGTLAAVLAGKKIRTFQDRYRADVTGDIEDVEGVLKITRIDVRYQLKLPEEQREDARRALDSYLHLCPAAQSVIGCIKINHELNMEDLPA
ncbi:MAG TPA: OsmC family peroxiredoxin [Desulfobacterales bacterium]|nr:OsmC family peroxiredoxin [Desulfobacterales bacterium]